MRSETAIAVHGQCNPRTAAGAEPDRVTQLRRTQDAPRQAQGRLSPWFWMSLTVLASPCLQRLRILPRGAGVGWMGERGAKVDEVCRKMCRAVCRAVASGGSSHRLYRLLRPPPRPQPIDRVALGIDLREATPCVPHIALREWAL